MQTHRSINTLTSILRRAWLVVAVIFSLLLPVTGTAQDKPTVSLRFANGQDSISGPLVDFKDEKFFIEASIGLVAIPTNGVICVGEACPEGTRLVIDNAAVVLTSKDGTVTISGDLIEIDNNEYVLATVVGEQRIAADMVNCAGQGCLPLASDLPADKTVELTAGETTLKGKLIRFENNSFVLDHAEMGVIRVSASKFGCAGPGCP